MIFNIKFLISKFLYFLIFYTLIINKPYGWRDYIGKVVGGSPQPLNHNQMLEISSFLYNSNSLIFYIILKLLNLGI